MSTAHCWAAALRIGDVAMRSLSMCDQLFAVLDVEDAVMRLNPASANLVEIRVKRT